MAGQIIWGMIGAVCLLYGLIVSRVGSGTLFFVVWIALAFISWGCALACRMHLWQRLPAAVRGIVLASLIVFAGVFLLTESRILSGFRTRAPDMQGMNVRGEDEQEKDMPGVAGGELDVLIVLGAQVRKTGPSTVLKQRLDIAAAYLLGHEKTRCIVSGSQGYNEPETEAAVMKRYLIGCGVPEARITEEKQAKNTRENILYSMQKIDPERDRVGIVTNNFHIFRGTAIAKTAGIAHVYGLAAPANRLYLPNNLLREFFGVMKDVLQGNIDRRYLLSG